jgi:hypothetical protein
MKSGAPATPDILFPHMNPAPDPSAPTVSQALQANDAAYSAFESTGVQILRLVSRLESPEAAPELPHDELLRRLLEFLHAAHFLITQSSAMAEMDGALHQEVAVLRDAAFAVDPMARFMEEIVVGMKHRAAPRLSLAHCAAPAPKRCALHMDVSQMLFWPHWSEPARRFLHRHQPSLPVFPAVHGYQQAVRMFRQRAVRSFRRTFAEAIAAAPPPPVMMRIM